MAGDVGGGSRSNGEDVVEGEIHFPPDAVFAGATVHVRLLDATVADGPSRTVAEQTIPNVSHPRGAGGTVAFAVRGSGLDARARYVVRVHVDVDGDGRVSRGDYISTESYPVLTLGYPNRVVVRVRPVGY
ncbi:MAG: YbaY family lipoprotein [Gammaproteobacteria bacterium]